MKQDIQRPQIPDLEQGQCRKCGSFRVLWHDHSAALCGKKYFTIKHTDKISSKMSESLVTTETEQKLHKCTKNYQQLTDMPAPDQFKPTKSCVLIICKITPNSSSTRLRITVHCKSYNKDTTHVMPKTSFKYSALISMYIPCEQINVDTKNV